MRRFLQSLLVRRILLTVLAGVVLVALWKFIALLRHEVLGSYYQDVDLYLAVGRGMLNGLTPYVDLFETKPPGIFLVSALSLRFFGDATLLLWIEALLLPVLPVIILLPVVRWDRRLFTVMIAALFGIFLTLYVGEAAGQGVSESFGAAFAVGAVVIAALYPRRFPVMPGILLSVLLFLSLFTKEPFLLSILGAILIVSPSFKSMQRMVLPLIIAGGLFLLGLLLTKTLLPYFSIYLRHMFGHQIAVPWGVIPDPLWIRTIHIPRLWTALQTFSLAMPFLIFSLWVAAFAVTTSEADPGRTRRLVVLRWLLGSWLLTLSIGITGDFYSHHFVFAVPGFVALFLVCIREHEMFLSTVGKISAAAWIGILCLGILLKPSVVVHLDPAWLQRDSERRAAAMVIDDVMDRCGVDRYLLMIAPNDGIQGYTKHSPLGPLFTLYPRFIAGHPLFLEKHTENLRTATIAVERADQPRPLIDEQSAQEFRTGFTDVPPVCVGKDFVQPVPFRILFRVGYFP